jgi:hypothetical protein
MRQLKITESITDNENSSLEKDIEAIGGEGLEAVEENLTLEEQRINEMLSESIDLSQYPGVTPHSFPPEFMDDCITLEQFAEEGRALIRQEIDKLYGISN